MSMPKKFNREKEPLKDLVAVVLNKENYINAEGELHQVKISMKSNSSAKYARERLYNIFKCLEKEAKEAGFPPPNRPVITKQGNFLIFTWKENRGKVQWEVVEND